MHVGHAVFPSLYTSMREKRRFGQVLVVAFTCAVLLYGGMAVVGCAFRHSMDVGSRTCGM